MKIGFVARAGGEGGAGRWHATSGGCFVALTGTLGLCKCKQGGAGAARMPHCKQANDTIPTGVHPDPNWCR